VRVRHRVLRSPSGTTPYEYTKNVVIILENTILVNVQIFCYLKICNIRKSISLEFILEEMLFVRFIFFPTRFPHQWCARAFPIQSIKPHF
jgi:hypothetical protein